VTGTLSGVDLAGLLRSWEIALRAEGKSPHTVESDGDGVRRFLAWAERAGRVPLVDRPTVAAVVHILDTAPPPSACPTGMSDARSTTSRSPADQISTAWVGPRSPSGRARCTAYLDGVAVKTEMRPTVTCATSDTDMTNMDDASSGVCAASSYRPPAAA
jgi:hypothetical protein